jgi:alpha-tubulin suppressor-like RCC1 family protein
MKKGLNSSSVLRAFLCAVAAIFLCQSLSSKPAGHGVGWGLTLTSPGVIVTNISARGDHSLALRNDGTIISWGNVIAPPKSVGDVVAISAGGSATNQFGLALTTNGTVLGWNDYTGYPYQGETPPADLTNVVAISAGGHHAMALKSDGSVLTWGYGSGPSQSIVPGLTNAIAISAGEYCNLTLRSNGTVSLWPGHNPPFLNDSSNVIAIAAGYATYAHQLWLKADGRVVLWNDGATQQLPDITNAVAIAIGEDASTYHVLALRNDGTVYTYGDNIYGQSTVPSGLSNVIAIAAGRYHSVALRSDGTVVCWGDNRSGQCNYPVPVSDIVAVSAGARYNLALKKDGTVSDWMGNRTFPYGLNLSNIMSVCAGAVTNGFALRKDRFVTAWGNYNYPYVPGFDKVAAIAMSSYHGFAVKTNGTVAVWTYAYPPNPGAGTLPSNLSNVVAVSTSPWIVPYAGGASRPSDFALALKSDGRVTGWGDNNYYPFNVGPTNVPADLSNVVSIAAGGRHGLALKNDSTVVGWGFNQDGEATGVPNLISPYASTGQVMIAGQVLSNVVAIAAGFTHSLALKNDGTVVAWGRNVDGEATVPAGVSNVVAISAGFYQSLAIVADLKIDSIHIASQGPALDFHTFAGQQYLVEFSPDLTPGSWLPLGGGNVSGTGSDTEVIDSDGATAAGRFYRLRLMP